MPDACPLLGDEAARLIVAVVGDYGVSRHSKLQRRERRRRLYGRAIAQACIPPGLAAIDTDTLFKTAGLEKN